MQPPPSVTSAHSLYRKKLGDRGTPILILHGMFGMGDNWQTVGRKLAGEHVVYLVDARNHGRSPHAPEMNYELMAEDIHRLMEEEALEKVSIIGHSMGGKTAMTFAAKYPERVDKLVIVDIAPRAYLPGHLHILEAFEKVDLDKKTRAEIEAQLTKLVPTRAITLFLMKNLKRKTDGGFEWKLNLDAFRKDYGKLLAEVDFDGVYDDIPVLLIKGANSPYVKPADVEALKRHFPKAVLHEIRGAAHWVHAEQPDALLEAVRAFLKHRG